MTTVLSGIQPSGRAHLGNYFGAIEPHIALQELEAERFYFIADYHALTTVRDPAELAELVLETAVAYLSLGLDPARVTLFRQSDVPEVTELTWLLSCLTGMGLLERAHSYKDKVARGIKPSVGLFTYPVLMAADILAYDSNLVPVGRDQLQHVEMAQDMAGFFNGAYGDVFVRPEPRIPEQGLRAKVPGVDGEKMSKTYGNTIWIFESGKRLKKVVGRIQTDSRPPEEGKDPEGIQPLWAYFELFLEPSELDDWRGRISRGGPEAPGYGHMKARLLQAIDERFAPARARREELLADRSAVERVLADGAGRARERARRTLARARRACGLDPAGGTP